MPSRPLRPIRGLVPLALATLVVAAGCAPQSSSKSKNTPKFQGAQKDVAQAVDDLESAANDGDSAKICTDIISAQFRQKLAARGPCAAVVKKAIRDADTVSTKVDQVHINGDTATARVTYETGKKDRTGTIPLVREGGGWRIDTL